MECVTWAAVTAWMVLEGLTAPARSALSHCCYSFVVRLLLEPLLSDCSSQVSPVSLLLQHLLSLADTASVVRQPLELL